MAKKILTENGGTVVASNGKAIIQELPVIVNSTNLTLPQSFTAIEKPIITLKRYGLCTQASTPNPTSPVDIITNVGAIGIDTVNSKEEVDENGDWLSPTYT